jgi:hypothetical protein
MAGHWQDTWETCKFCTHLEYAPITKHRQQTSAFSNGINNCHLSALRTCSFFAIAARQQGDLIQDHQLLAHTP